MQQSATRQAAQRPTGQARTVTLSANSSWNIVNFRGGLIRALGRNGYRVVVVAPADQHSAKLADLGAEFVPLAINSSGLSVGEDLRLLLRYRRILRKIRPFAFLGFTAKPNIYGSIAARMVGARVINNISGLGTLFIKRGLLTVLMTGLYRYSLRTSATVFFQNRDDMELFIGQRTVRARQARLLPGSGVNLDHFRSGGGRREPGALRFLLVGRLLWDKGVGEFVEAARAVRRSHPEIRFQMLGPAGVNNRTAVPVAALERWDADGLIEYLGESDDVRTAMDQADCIVLPSYREGLPRALLEGSALGKPLIATDVPGCRDVVVEGETGYLCEARSGASLAAAMLRMIELPPAERTRMGQAGRRRVEQQFGEDQVIAKYLEALET